MKKLLLYILALAFGTLYANFLSTDEGKAWIDENTTLGVVIGVGSVLGALRLGLDKSSWQTVSRTFVAAGLPLVVRGIQRKLEG